MSVYHQCRGCGRTSEAEQIRHAMYIGQRTIGDFQALRRGRLGKRLVRRTVTRHLMRALWGS